ncbi:MAG: OsmC family protein [Gemmatimonadota bacterium]|nr:OsmC family protein [Gemmatimonadota bacterium]
MADYFATIEWQRTGAIFTDNRYSRAHQWSFDGGAVVPGSSSPHSVKLPLSDPAAVDPEEAFVASIASCHMLWFLNIAALRGFVIDRYTDAAVGVMGTNAEGKLAMVTVTLHPDARFIGDKLPSADDAAAMHHEAHDKCYIANSVKTDVRCEPVTL